MIINAVSIMIVAVATAVPSKALAAFTRLVHSRPQAVSGRGMSPGSKRRNGGTLSLTSVRDSSEAERGPERGREGREGGRERERRKGGEEGERGRGGRETEEGERGRGGRETEEGRRDKNGQFSVNTKSQKLQPTAWG